FIEAIEVLEDPGSPFKFVALDPAVHLRVAGGRPVRANMNVIVTPVSPGLTFEGHRRAPVAPIRRPIGPARGDVVVINCPKAARIRAYREDPSVDPAVTFLELQYAFLKHGNGIYITYEVPKQLQSQYDPVFRASSASIRVE